MEWKLQPGKTKQVEMDGLGNFLSGMETPRVQTDGLRVGALGNFLSGMETQVGDGLDVDGTALETSLVEWKHEFFPGIIKAFLPWKLP